MKRYIAFLLCVLLLLTLGGCAGVQEEQPITLTIWHVYGGQTDSPLNDLIAEFNRTVGKEHNIKIQVTSVTNTNTIHEAVLSAANNDPGAAELPDMFISYPKTVLAMPEENILVDYRDYFSEEELSAFIPAFIEEGTIHDRLAILPVAKSTEILFINKTLFDRFAGDTGATVEELDTWEGLFQTAARYAEWSGGKTFFVHDYHFNYFQVGVEALGESFFDEDGIAFGSAFAKAWQPYAEAALQSGVWLYDGYATEPLRTGDAVVSVASSASVLYYSDIVTYPDNTSEEIEYLARPCPIFEGGEKLVMQRGAGICTVKSTPEREKAAMVFLKWLTAPEQNVELVTRLGYMPVTQEAFDTYLPQAIEQLEDPKYKELYRAFLMTQEEYTFYTPPQREDYLSLETSFEAQVRLLLSAALKEYDGTENLSAAAARVLQELQKYYGK
ncbi:MAG: extracellular solute-binding protein [Faecousia sp.]